MNTREDWSLVRKGIYAVGITIIILAMAGGAQARTRPDHKSSTEIVHAKREVRVSLHEIGVHSIKWVHCDHPEGRLDALCATRYAYPRNQKPWMSCTIIRDCNPERMMADGVIFRVHCREHMHVYYSSDFMDDLIKLGPGMKWGEDYWTIAESIGPPRCWVEYQSPSGTSTTPNRSSNA